MEELVVCGDAVEVRVDLLRVRVRVGSQVRGSGLELGRELGFGLGSGLESGL